MGVLSAVGGVFGGGGVPTPVSAGFWSQFPPHPASAGLPTTGPGLQPGTLGTPAAPTGGGLRGISEALIDKVHAEQSSGTVPIGGIRGIAQKMLDQSRAKQSAQNLSALSTSPYASMGVGVGVPSSPGLADMMNPAAAAIAAATAGRALPALGATSQPTGPMATSQVMPQTATLGAPMAPSTASGFGGQSLGALGPAAPSGGDLAGAVVRVQAPNGNIYSVPSAQVSAAIQQGGQVLLR